MTEPEKNFNNFSNSIYRIENLEKEVAQLKQQLSLYEPVRENDLKLQSIKDTSLRIENELGKVKDKLEVMTNKLVLQEQELNRRDSSQKEQIDKLQIRILWGVVSTILAMGTAVLIGYITHFFH
jgi:hypothetical protein